MVCQAFASVLITLGRVVNSVAPALECITEGAVESCSHKPLVSSMSHKIATSFGLNKSAAYPSFACMSRRAAGYNKARLARKCEVETNEYVSTSVSLDSKRSHR